jgi:hypothetical protein
MLQLCLDLRRRDATTSSQLNRFVKLCSLIFGQSNTCGEVHRRRRGVVSALHSASL